MKRHEIDSEIKQKNYEKELLLCKKAGGDVEKYRRLSLDVLQLEQIRIGLESGIDVSAYLDSKKSWMEMEEVRVSMETGFDMKTYLEKGFDWLQCNEIRLGLKDGLDISQYKNTAFLAPQMREIRKGLKHGIDVSQYATTEFDWFQMKEIRLGLEDKLDVSCYASTKYKHPTMCAIRKGLLDNVNLVPYAEKGYTGKVLTEIHRGIKLKNDIIGYLKQGYNAEQLMQINNAFESGVNLSPYLKIEFHGVQLQEIITGLKKKLDVSKYAKQEYNWFQMREIRYGLEQGVDVSQFANPEFTPRQMEVIRKGVVEGVDVSPYAKLYYEPEEMEEIRKRIQNEGAVLTAEVSQALQNTLLSGNDEDEETRREEKEAEQGAKKTDYIEKPADETETEETDEIFENIGETGKTEEDGEADETLDMAFDACIVVSEDKMSVSIDFSQVKDILRKKLEKLEVSDIMLLLKNRDVKQGISRNRIKAMLDNKTYDKPVVIAEGKEAVNGENGEFTYYFRKKLDRKPRVLEDGSVDYKNMTLFESVEKDKLIAEYKPATVGMFGYDVTGKLISPKKGKELAPLRGQGFSVSEDKKKYYSQMDGIIELDELDGKINIRNLYTVSGNVDASTGNINFNGDVNVMGNVEAGFSVTATGNIVIDGHCEGCHISAGKDVVIRKGCQGQGVAEISAEGSITGQFFETVTLRSKGDVRASYLLNCQLRTEGHLLVEGRKGVIIGGYTCAKNGITCHKLGNIAEIKTVLEVGIDKEDMTSYQEIGKKIDKVEAEMKTCEIALNRFIEQKERDEKVSALIGRLTKAIYSQKNQKKALLKEREEHMLRLMKQKGARVKVTGVAYPGTLIYMNAELYSVKDTMNNVEFVKMDSKVNPIMR